MRPIRDAARVDGNHADAVEGSLIAKCFEEDLTTWQARSTCSTKDVFFAPEIYFEILLFLPKKEEGKANPRRGRRYTELRHFL